MLEIKNTVKNHGTTTEVSHKHKGSSKRGERNQRKVWKIISEFPQIKSTNQTTDSGSSETIKQDKYQKTTTPGHTSFFRIKTKENLERRSKGEGDDTLYIEEQR